MARKKKDLEQLDGEAVGLIPCRFVGSAAVPAHVAEGTTSWISGETKKKYEKNSDGLFLIDPRDAAAAARHGFVREG